MKWLTKEEIREAAEKSHLAACECSLEHWMQIKAAGAGELREAMNEDLVGVCCSYCALCVRYRGKGKGLFCGGCSLACGSLWGHAEYTIRKWKRYEVSYKEVQKAITPLVKKLRNFVRKAKKTKK